MTLQVTSLITGLFLFIMVLLSLLVSLRRLQMKAKYGDATTPPCAAASAPTATSRNTPPPR